LEAIDASKTRRLWTDRDQYGDDNHGSFKSSSAGLFDIQFGSHEHLAQNDSGKAGPFGGVGDWAFDIGEHDVKAFLFEYY
jgi:hypothetical protein